MLRLLVIIDFKCVITLSLHQHSIDLRLQTLQRSHVAALDRRLDGIVVVVVPGARLRVLRTHDAIAV